MFKNCHYTESELQKITQEYGSPIYVYDEQNIKSNATIFLNTFRKYIPNFNNLFAIKALPNLQILKILHEVGMGFDASSLHELQLANFICENNYDDNIIYTSNYTSINDLKTLEILKH